VGWHNPANRGPTIGPDGRADRFPLQRLLDEESQRLFAALRTDAQSRAGHRPDLAGPAKRSFGLAIGGVIAGIESFFTPKGWDFSAQGNALGTVAHPTAQP
jgi:hypothetical protein